MALASAPQFLLERQSARLNNRLAPNMPADPSWRECRRCQWLVPRVVQVDGPTLGYCEACAALTDLAQL
eukprot:13606661-Alexandrium_andersonii.AAC.1